MLIAGVVIGWFHIMAVVAVLGGSFFINTVLGSVSKNLTPPEAGKLNQGVGEAFGKVAWISTIVILITGVMRAAGLDLFKRSVLIETTYGNLLLVKIVLFAVIIVNMVGITRTGLNMAKMVKANAVATATDGGQADPGLMAAAQKRIKTLGTTNLILGLIVVACAVGMRFIGAP